MLAFGVGSGMGDPNTAHNLRTISGRDEYTPTPDPDDPHQTSNLLEADWVQTTDWELAAEAMRGVVLQACAPTVSVIKRIVPDGGTVDDAVLPESPWGFEATTTTIGVTLTPETPPYALTDSGSGGVSFDVDFADPAESPATIRVEEDAGAQPGYTPLPDETVCVERSTGTDISVTTTADGAAAFFVDVGLDEMVTCVVYNQAPPPPPDTEPASVVVHKVWEIHSLLGVQSIPDGGQPSGLSATLSLTGPASTDASEQNWSAPRTGYLAGSTDPAQGGVTITEAVAISDRLPLCAAGDPVIAPGAPDDGEPGTELGAGLTADLDAGVNEWTIRNVITCESRLTLEKEVSNGPLATPEGEALWQLTAYGPGGYEPIPAELTGTTGSTAVTDAEVVPDATYQLAEKIPSPVPDHYMEHYVQNDIRTRPLQFPQSTGSWTCQEDADPQRNPSLGAEGAVIVPLGMAYTCTAVNTTSLLTVDKTVDGVPAANPSDWLFELTPHDPILVPDPLTHQFTAAEEQSVVPGQLYGLDEIETPDGYELDNLSCTSGGDPIDGFPTDFSLLPGAIALCTANNATIPPGSFEVTKSLAGTAAGDTALDDVEFTIMWTADTTPAQSGQFTLIAGETHGPTVDFPEGTTITLDELAPTGLPDGIVWSGVEWSGADVTPLPDGTAQLVIERQATLTATATNTVLEPGQFSVQKLVSGTASADAALSSAIFTFAYTVDGAAGAQSPFTLQPGEIFASEGLPSGSEIAVNEIGVSLPDGYEQDGVTWQGGTPDGDTDVTAVIGSDAAAALTATNAVSRLWGELSIRKAFAPESPAWLDDAAYSGAYSCTFTDATMTGIWTITGSGDATLTPDDPDAILPVGAACTVTEGSLPTDIPTGWTWGTPVISPTSVTISADAAVVVTVTNAAVADPAPSPMPPSGGTLPMAALVIGLGALLAGAGLYAIRRRSTG